ncbi:carbohydrate kinase family protein [Actinoplanes palleronii]|uniref:Kinase n=1 Tax=Actinoplanes palleronii TaxID=113570 RepID=A0ABQ4B174_9ACTN|nr:carbohydrate kinase family protein [Actinoplanes palleronii]GIE64423.1 kinase [Actinoplanes palleronii]
MGRIAVTGSIATDHLMRFPGSFSEQLLPDQLHTVSLSFLVDALDVRYGGVAGNIAYGLGRLGLSPFLIGAVGADFAAYRTWLESHGVDCEFVRVSETAQTSRFTCTTDTSMCQIASFYPGAMAEAAQIDLAPLLARSNPPDLVIVAADDPAAMMRHADQCRRIGQPFVADPSQQLATMPGGVVTAFITGADYLVTNEYEEHLLLAKSGLTPRELLDRVAVQVTTLGERGVRITGRDIEPVCVPAAGGVRPVDPTGAGDAFRAGFFGGLGWGLPPRRAAEVGCQLGALALESVGTQEYTVDPAGFGERLAASYGDEAAADVWSHWTA